MAAGDDAARPDLFQAARDYLDLLRQHIFKEDNVLFMMGDRVMTEEDQAELAERFCAPGCRAFGGKRGEELVAMADDLERTWGGA
jgi:hemerythrin-like domain-containing protein